MEATLSEQDIFITDFGYEVVPLFLDPPVDQETRALITQEMVQYHQQHRLLLNRINMVLSRESLAADPETNRQNIEISVQMIESHFGVLNGMFEEALPLENPDYLMGWPEKLEDLVAKSRSVTEPIISQLPLPGTIRRNLSHQFLNNLQSFLLFPGKISPPTVTDPDIYLPAFRKALSRSASTLNNLRITANVIQELLSGEWGGYCNFNYNLPEEIAKVTGGAHDINYIINSEGEIPPEHLVSQGHMLEIIQEFCANNIIKYCNAENGNLTVKIDLSMGNNELIVSIADNGGGMSADQLETVNAPVVQTKKKGGAINSGIGRLLLQDRGIAWHYSNNPEGTTLILKIPSNYCKVNNKKQILLQ